MNYIPLGIKTDYSLLKSLIKIPDLIEYAKKNNITTLGILDDNLYSSMCFYDSCIKNDIKPIIGLNINISTGKIYLYAKNYNGYKNLLKINSLMQDKELNYIDLKKYNKDIICVLPYSSSNIYKEIKDIYSDLFIGYGNDYEKKNAFTLSKNCIFINELCTIDFNDIRYLKILRAIDGVIIELKDYNNAYLERDIPEEDINNNIKFSELINIEIPKNNRYIPHYDDNINDSFSYLASLCKKGLSKRLNNNVPKEYMDRLIMELNVIKKMGFVDYFLIVFDYVRYAKTHNILVGPGRGSAAGSLVSYSIGITEIDPIKYDLLFERFLNPERITMPDIDIDFEYTKRDQVIGYVRDRYGKEKVANIMTFGTLGSRQVIRDIGKVLNVNSLLIDKLSNIMDPKSSLKDNLGNKYVSELLNNSSDLKKVYQVSFKFEGLKRHISTHAAGVVLSSIELDDVIPIVKSDSGLLTGCTMEYLEELGLLKMDFLALRNLTIIQNVIDLISDETGKDVNLSEIPLDDKNTLDVFKRVDTEGIFQFESSGMKNFLSKLEPDSFNDLIAAVALFRPGPMNNIDSFIRRKHGKEKITYPDDTLKDILESTYGIMIYQEQIMQILVKMGNYSFAEADNIRRAMSKKKKDVMEKEREVFVTRAMDNCYTEAKANEVYDLIIKFADYGFNKAHSVSYALIGYQMAYLKANYPVYFMANLLNMSIGSDIKTKEYMDEAKRNGIKVFKPNINVSTNYYLIKDNCLLLPLNSIHNVGSTSVNDILEERKNGSFKDYFDFVVRTYGKSINRKTIESLIDGDALRDFNLNHKTLNSNIDNALDYAILCGDLDESLVMKPDLIIEDEYDENELMARELNSFGFYVTNHPASRYQKDVMKLEDIKKNFDKNVSLVVIINNVRKIKTKKGEDMGFFLGSDETDSGDFIVFPKQNKYLLDIKQNDLVRVNGHIERRNDKYQVIVNNIEKL